MPYLGAEGRIAASARSTRARCAERRLLAIGASEGPSPSVPHEAIPVRLLDAEGRHQLEKLAARRVGADRDGQVQRLPVRPGGRVEHEAERVVTAVAEVELRRGDAPRPGRRRIAEEPDG